MEVSSENKKKQNDTVKESSSSQKKNLGKRNVLYILMICLGSLLILVSSSVISALFLYKADLEALVDHNLGKVPSSVIVYDTFSYYIDDGMEISLKTEINEILEGIEFNGVNRFELTASLDDEPAYIIGSSSDPVTCSDSLATQKLLPVGHFYWVRDEIKTSELSSVNFITLETHKQSAEKILASIGNINELTVVEDLEALRKELSKGELMIGLISYGELEPKLKLLRVGGHYYLDDPTIGALSTCLYVKTLVDDGEFIQNIIEKNLLALVSDLAQDSWTDPELGSILSVRMTGVTALSRNIAIKIDQSGDPAYAAKKIGEFLSSADITHTSNEVSFVEGCTPTQSMSFCSAPEYIESLKASGIDIVELTGNHNNDYGADNNARTIEMYGSLGWDHFGGGSDEEDAARILYVEREGSKIAFIGYNYFDTVNNSGAIASTARAGANSYSLDKVASDVAEARENADIVIVDFQFQECFSYPEDGGIYPPCYRPLSIPDQRQVFRNAIEQGADIVIGTQAHQPQTYELYDEGMIFYGLGNLFFDQIPWIGTRQGLVLTHYFDNGEHLQTKIDTTLYDREMQPYVTYGNDRELLLNLLLEAR